MLLLGSDAMRNRASPDEGRNDERVLDRSDLRETCSCSWIAPVSSLVLALSLLLLLFLLCLWCIPSKYVPSYDMVVVVVLLLL
jgi:hypothetical protein